MPLDTCTDCQHSAHEAWGCSESTCNCETMWTDAQAISQLAEDRRIIEEEYVRAHEAPTLNVKQRNDDSGFLYQDTCTLCSHQTQWYSTPRGAIEMMRYHRMDSHGLD